LDVHGRWWQLQPLQDLRLNRREGGGREHVHEIITDAQALLDEGARGAGGDQLGAGDGEVVATLGTQAHEALPALGYLPPGLALDAGEEEEGDQHHKDQALQASGLVQPEGAHVQGRVLAGPKAAFHHRLLLVVAEDRVRLGLPSGQVREQAVEPSERWY
jgi:hypothetical protein